jgi:predicted anti-sigma-YlaC factor YlaD
MDNQKEIDQKTLEVLEGEHQKAECASVQLHIRNCESCTNKLASDKEK